MFAVIIGAPLHPGAIDTPLFPSQYDTRVTPFTLVICFQVYISRSAGCDHMICSQCKTEFCYRCGDRFLHFKYIGDHYNRLSIFGCKYRLWPDRPVRRKFVRGAIFGTCFCPNDMFLRKAAVYVCKRPINKFTLYIFRICKTETGSGFNQLSFI